MGGVSCLPFRERKLPVMFERGNALLTWVAIQRVCLKGCKRISPNPPWPRYIGDKTPFGCR